MKKLKKNKGILFWITGLPGSGKTSIAEKIHNVISKRYGSTITISGDDLRKIFNYNKFSRKYRLAYALNYGKFCKCIADKKINTILSTVSLFHNVRKWNKSNISNYIEIYIQSDINKIIKQKNKFFYKGNYINIVITLLFWLGVSFEAPLVMFFLSKMGIITPKVLAKQRRYALVVAFILGALITPTFDPINQSLVAIPIILLYELGIWLARLARLGRRKDVIAANESGSEPV